MTIVACIWIVIDPSSSSALALAVGSWGSGSSTGFGRGGRGWRLSTAFSQASRASSRVAPDASATPLNASITSQQASSGSPSVQARSRRNRSPRPRTPSSPPGTGAGARARSRWRPRMSSSVIHPARTSTGWPAGSSSGRRRMPKGRSCGGLACGSTRKGPSWVVEEAVSGPGCRGLRSYAPMVVLVAVVRAAFTEHQRREALIGPEWNDVGLRVPRAVCVADRARRLDLGLELLRHLHGRRWRWSLDVQVQRHEVPGHEPVAVSERALCGAPCARLLVTMRAPSSWQCVGAAGTTNARDSRCRRLPSRWP